MNQLDLKGRHAIITGGASGLGYAISERMIASGATVTWWDVNADVMANAAKISVLQRVQRCIAKKSISPSTPASLLR